MEKEEEKKEETTVQAEPTTVIAPVTTAVSGESELERAMQATLDYENKKAAAENAADDANSAVKSTAADLSDTEYQRELRRRQCDVFRDLLRDKVSLTASFFLVLPALVSKARRLAFLAVFFVTRIHSPFSVFCATNKPLCALSNHVK